MPRIAPHGWAQPFTGENGPYLDPGLTSGLVGHGDARAAALIDPVDRRLSRPATAYRHDWRPGDVVIVDNFRVAHKATVPTSALRLVVDRTTVEAGTAYRRYLAQRRAARWTPGSSVGMVSCKSGRNSRILLPAQSGAIPCAIDSGRGF